MPLTVEEGKALVTEFCKSYPSALQVNFKLRQNQEELFNGKETIEAVGKILGAYFPASNIAGFATSNFRDQDEFKETLRHEIIGHFGINTFPSDEKRLIVTAIADAKNQPGLKELWDSVDSLYPNTPELLRAEEVYAFVCEAVNPDLVNKPLAKKALQDTCFDQTRPMQLNDLMNITNLVADEMRQGIRQQQTFPLTDKEQFKRDTNMEPKKPFHEVVAEKLIKQLETNTAPWQKPWEPGQAGFMPMNPTTGKRYKGINAIQLMSQGHDDNRWMTYKQAEAVGAQVRKGEKGTPVQYWKFTDEQIKKDEQGKPVLDENNEPIKITINLERPRVFMATVFNAEQIDGLPPLEVKAPVQEWEANERAEKILSASGANIKHSESDRAFYRYSTDSIHLPEKHQFPTEGNYYATALHELGHWTGHATRLDRDLQNPHGSEAYAKEELRAEIASMILGDEIGIGHDPAQHVAYVGSWIKVLKEDPMEIFRAAADAEKIKDFVLSLEQQQEITKEQDITNTLTEYQQTALNYLSRHHGLTELNQNQRDFLTNASQQGDAPIVGAMGLAEELKLNLTDAGLTYAVAQNLVHYRDNISGDQSISFIDGGFDADKGINKYTLNVTDSPYKHVIGVDFKNNTAQLLDTIDKAENISIEPRFTQFKEDLNSLSELTQQRAKIDSPLQNHAGFDRGIQEQESLSMSSPATPGLIIEENDEPRLWQLDDAELYGEKAGWWMVVSADEEEDLSLPFPTEEEAEAERQRIVAQHKFVEAFKNQSALDIAAESQAAFGFNVPQDWNGNVQFRGNILEEEDGEKFVIPASERGVEPQFYSLYAQLNDGTHEFLADYDTFDQAIKVKHDLEIASADIDPNPLERAAKMARVFEERIRLDPQSTDEQISAAKETRKDAEMAAMLNDGELQKEIAKAEKANAALTSVNAEQTQKITYINVPYAEKEQAKQLGAKWDRKEQSWYVPPGANLEPFSKWAQGASVAAAGALSGSGQALPTGVASNSAPERVYLAVPYGERAAAKQAGAQWDKAAKSWFIGANADQELIKRWLPENVTAEQAPAKTPQEEFADALRSVGCVVPPGSPHPIMDGKKHRIETIGDKNGERAGFYVGHLDGHPAGYIKNNKTGVEMRWKAKGYSLSDQDKAKLNAEAAAKLAQRDAELEKTQQKTSDRINKHITSLVQITTPTPYLQEKAIAVHTGALTDAEGKTTFLPAQDVTGKVWTMQYISEDGTKRFAKDSKKEGSFHVVGGMSALEKAPALVVSEGYATAATASESLGIATVAAFDSGNLSKVVKDLHEKFPDKPVIVIGDDDRHLLMTQGVNVGRDKAIAAAQEVGGKAIFPVFTPNESSYPGHLPPITPEAFRKNQLSEEQKEALATLKRFTDFNDLATKSELGKEGVHRQLNSAVQKVIEETRSQREMQSLELSRKSAGVTLDQEQTTIKKRGSKIA